MKANERFTHKFDSHIDLYLKKIDFVAVVGETKNISSLNMKRLMTKAVANTANGKWLNFNLTKRNLNF